jgi:hypothetical protein
MSANRKTSQSHQTPRRDVFPASRTIDPRKSREAAWEAIERENLFANPAYGAGLDEEPILQASAGGHSRWRQQPS